MRSAAYLTTNAATASGANSIALGSGAYTLGGGTVAIGTATQAQGLRAVALGNTSMANGVNAVAIGYNVTASGTNGININGIFNFDGTTIRLSNSTVITGSLTTTTGAIISGSLIVTGSSTFTGNQIISGSLIVTGSSTLQSTVFSGSVRGEVQALSISSNTASLDCSTDNFFTLLLVSGSNTFVNPSNILPGQTINLRVKQASVASGSISFASSVKQVSGSAYTPTATANGEDIITLISFDSTNLYLSNIKNFV